MELYAHQKKVLDAFPHKSLLAHGLGSGKTITALALAQKANVSTLIICPKMLKGKWEREAKEWINAPLAQWIRLCKVVTKEEFRRDYKTLGKYDAVIVDEAHSGFASLKSQLHKALYVYLKVHKVEYVWLLTGTPYTSTPFSIYALARLLGHAWSWSDFRHKYFRERYIGRRVIFEPRTGIEDEIAELVKQIGSVVRLDECVDVPSQTFAEEEFAYTKEQLSALKEMQEKESNPLTRFGKAHQIAQGILIGDEYTPTKTFKALKNERIIEIAEENDKVIVFSRYNAHLDLLSDMLNGKGILNVIINGATEDRDSVISAANSAKRVIVLIQAECAEGYELPSFRIMIHASHSYSYVKYNQAQGRILRINALKPNYYLSLITKGSADEPVMDAMRKKMDFHEAIYAKNDLIETLRQD